MIFIKKHRLFLIISLLIALIDAAFVGMTYLQAKHNLHQEEQRLAINHFSAFDITYKLAQRNMLQIANIVANTPSYQTLFLAGKYAVEQEGGGAGGVKSQQARDSLNNAVSANWQQFTSRFHARQLHFHLGPGSTSFLRVHKPTKFGDNMDEIRHTIVDTNLLQKEVMGFETGRVYSGIRGTSPVSIVNSEGISEHIGAVEAGVSFESILNNLTEQSNIDAAVLLYKDHLVESVWPDYLEKRLKESFVVNDLVLEQSTSDQIIPLAKLSAQATPKTSHYHSKIQSTDIDVQVIELNNLIYLYTFKPLRDYLGTTDLTRPNAGMIVVWQDISDIYSLFNKHLAINIIYGLLAFILVEILLFLTIRIVTHHLNKTINLQILELNSRNKVLEQLTSGVPIHSILESLIQILEEEMPDALCSILLLDHDGQHLTLGAAPSLPDFYNNAINGTKIGEGVGSCGTAAFTKKRVIVKDIQTHPYWVPYKALAAKANLAACWSEPVINHKGNVLGTFAIYHRTPTTPELFNLVIIESVIQLTALVIERKQAEEKLQLLSRIYEQTHEGLIITNTNGIIVDVNPMFCKITGYSRDEVIGENPGILSSGKQSPEFYADMWKALNASGHWQGEVWNRKKDGEIYAELLTISSIQDDDNNTSHYVGLFSDITLNKEQQKALEFMAHYDVLTQLPNRTLFIDRFNQAVAHCNRNETLLAICFLDLDEFKPVNDTYGHDVGDQLLIQVAERIKENIREEDTVSRQGGDEFALLLGDIDSPFHGEEILGRINRALAQTYIINHNSITISASIGVSLYSAEDTDLDTLLRHADQAMYQAKLAGRNRFQVFNAQEDQQFIQEQSQLKEIKHALDNNEFTLYYQPKVNMKTGDVFGAEALIRWIHPEKGLIPPLDFLPLIEGSELEINVGKWVVNEALSQLDEWQKQDITLEVSINISSHHLQSEDFCSHLESALSNHSNVDSHYLQLEILESSALGDLTAISNIIKTCQDTLGVNVALDDFGTGYSSLTHLRNLPANTIKIDQSFVRDMLDDPNDFAIIDGVISLADSFNREVIAEGVETTQHGLMLLLMGCDEAQGYGISRPIPAEKLVDWLHNYTPNQEWLNYANKYHSVKETKIKLLRLTTQHWFDEFKHIRSNKDDWSFISHKKCHQSAWIKRAKKEQLFDSSWLIELEQVHEEMYIIANNLVTKYKENESSVTEEDIKELEISFNKMNLILVQYE